MIDNNKEYIVSAMVHWDDSIKYPFQPTNINSGLCIAGHRHAQCILIGSKIFGYVKERVDKGIQETQGFLTSKNRFLNRKEAAELIIEIGQREKLVYFGGKELDSSDLY